MQRIGNQLVKRVYELAQGDIFRVHCTDPWKYVIRVDSKHIYFRNKCSSAYSVIGKNGQNFVSVKKPDIGSPYILAGCVRPGSFYTNGTPFNIAKELGDLNKFYEN